MKRRNDGVAITGPVLHLFPSGFQRMQHEYMQHRMRVASLATLARRNEKRALSNDYTLRILERAKLREDWERANSICGECGGKALYYVYGKKYCRKHLAVGKQRALEVRYQLEPWLRPAQKGGAQ